MSERIFKIRPCKNIKLLQKLHKETFPSDEWEDFGDFAAWVIYEGKDAVGFGIVSKFYKDPKVAYIPRQGVLARARGCRLQQRLLKVSVQYAKRKGFTKIIAYTKIDNVHSSRNFQRSNFELYLPKNKYADNDCLYWRKNL